MLPLVELPELVQHYAPFFADVFTPEAWQQFQRYVSGLLVSENKTVEGINRLFVIDPRHPSSLNRLLTESPFTVEAVNRARLALLASLPGTRMKPKGVLSLDDTLLTHYGACFEQIARLYDHTQGCYVLAHNLVNLHYSDDDTDYPVGCRLWKPADPAQLEAGLVALGIPLRASKAALRDTDPTKWRQYVVGVWRRQSHRPEVEALYQSKLRLGEQLVAAFVQAHPDLCLPVTFDSWYTQPGLCAYLDRQLQRPYVGTLTEAEPIALASGTTTLSAYAQQLRQQHQEVLAKGQAPVFRKIGIGYKGEREHYYSYCQTHRLPRFGRQRLVINHSREDLSDTPRFFVSNRLHWQAPGITRIRRHRWPVEVYHEEGKQEGLDQYQVRDFLAIEKHIALVAVTYSLLRAAPHDPALLQRLSQGVQHVLDGSAASGRRLAQAQALWALGVFIAAGLAQGQSLPHILHPLLVAFR